MGRYASFAPQPAGGGRYARFARPAAAEDEWEERGILLVNRRTGETKPKPIAGGQLAVTPAEEPGLLESAGRAVDRFATAGLEGLATTAEMTTPFLAMRAGRALGTLAGGAGLDAAQEEAGVFSADAREAAARAKERFAEVPLPPVVSAAASTGLEVAGQAVMDPSVALPGGAAARYLARRGGKAAALAPLAGLPDDLPFPSPPLTAGAPNAPTGLPGVSTAHQVLPAPMGPPGPMSTKGVTNVTGPIGETLQELAQENADVLQAARGGTKSVSRYHDAELLAVSLGMDVDDFLKLPAARILSDDELSLGRSLLGGLAEKAQAAAAGGQAGEVARLKLAQVKLMAVLQGKGASQAGRALRSLREQVTPFEASPATKLHSALLHNFQDQLDEDVLQKIALLDPDNPDEIIRFLGQMDRPTWKDYRASLWYGSVLSGPKTLLRNTLGNATKLLADTAMRPLEAVADAPLAKFQGRDRERLLRETPALLAGEIAGVRKGIQRFAHFMRKGYDPELLLRDLTGEEGKGKFDLPRVDPFLRSGKPAVQALGAALNVGPRILGATDVLFRSIAESGQRYAWATREAIREGAPDVADRAAQLLLEQPEAMLKDAQMFARKAVYMDEMSWIARGIVGLREGADERSAGMVGQLLFPFVRVSDRVAAALTDYVPGAKPRKLVEAVRSSKEGADLIARQVTGGAVAALALGLAGEERLTGPLPTDPEERSRFYDEGKQPYAIRVGDTWRPIRDLLGPLAAPVIVAERLYTAWKSRAKESVLADGAKALAGSALGLGRYLLDASYLDGLAGALKAIETGESEDGAEAAAQQGARWAAGHIPWSGALRSVAHARDPRVVDTSGSPLDRVKGDLPGLRETLPGRVGRYGEPLVRATGPIAGALSPIAGSPVRVDPLDAELKRLGLNPGFVGRKLGGETLSAEDRREYQKLSGGKAREMLLQELLSDPAYAQMTDEERRTAAERLMGRARAYARGIMLEKKLQGQQQRMLVGR